MSMNPGSIIVLLVLIVCVALIIRNIIKKHKAGSGGCGCGCGCDGSSSNGSCCSSKGNKAINK